MAIKVIGRIVLYEQLNQDKITDLLASADTIAFEIERRYTLGEMPELLAAVLPDQFDGYAVDYVESFKQIIDIASFVHEENAMMWVVNYDVPTKTFDLTASYVRDEVDSTATMGAIPTNQLIEAVFITPGLEGPVYTTVDLPYNGAISNPHKEALLAVGIELEAIVTGSLFQIKTQSVPFKVGFYQPASVTLEKYSIEFALQNKTIEI